MKADVLGVSFDAVTMAKAVSRALSMMNERRGAYVCTANPETVMLCRENGALMEAVRGADMVVADGVGVLLAAKMLARPLPERVAGFDLFTALLERMNGGVYLLGGRPGVAEAAARAIEERYPRVTVCGCRDGYFTDDADIVREIEAVSPELVAVCLGAEKQELWMAAHRGLSAGLMIGLGGSLDVLSGRVRRAPAAWRRHGLEWLWRLLNEPKRIKRQIRLPMFLAAVRRQRKQEWKKAD